MARAPKTKDVETLRHQDRRINNPTAEMAPIYEQNEELMGSGAQEIHLPRAFPLARGETRLRDGDLDPQIIWNGVRITLTQAQRQQLYETGEVEIGDAQLVWRGKDTQDWSDLVVNAPPLYIQEKVHPKAIIDDLKRRTDEARAATNDAPDLFTDFNGLTDPEDRYEFYRHSMHWQNRFILGDSLQVMASLAQREGLKGKVQAIYFDPPYGIKFNSNWQVSTLSRDVKDGKATDITREPEQVKAFRDTWKDGIHSYLTYLRDRLTVARELLTESGSIFVQIGDENVHRVRAVMDEVLGAENFVSEIVFRTSSGRLGAGLDGVYDVLLWFAKDRTKYKYRPFLTERSREQLARAFNYVQREDGTCFTLDSSEMARWLDGKVEYDVFQPSQTQSQSGGDSSRFVVSYEGKRFQPPLKGGWRSSPVGFERLAKAKRLYDRGATVRFRLKHSDYPYVNSSNIWMDTLSTTFGGGKTYVVETNSTVVQRCLLSTAEQNQAIGRRKSRPLGGAFGERREGVARPEFPECGVGVLMG